MACGHGQVGRTSRHAHTESSPWRCPCSKDRQLRPGARCLLAARKAPIHHETVRERCLQVQSLRVCCSPSNLCGVAIHPRSICPLAHARLRNCVIPICQYWVPAAGACSPNAALTARVRNARVLLCCVLFCSILFHPIRFFPFLILQYFIPFSFTLFCSPLLYSVVS